MQRWITPIVFAGASGAVWYYNGTHTDTQLVFPGLHLVPGHESMLAQGQLSWQLFAGVAGLSAAWATIGQLRALRRPAAD